jgi:ribonucleoside-diphosphate reductase alpha chain
VQVSKHLLRDHIRRNLWTDELRMQIIARNGSVQHLDLPLEVKEFYTTVWEIRQRIVVGMSADRGED